jgi:hypothetical protein
MQFHLMTLLEISHFNKNGDLLFRKNNIRNILHAEGEEYILNCLFGGVSVVQTYYVGLDNRNALSVSNSFSSLSNFETSGVGYFRQAVTNNSFQISTNSIGNQQANSPIVQFQCTGNNWTAKNIFLATAPRPPEIFSGPKKLISSVPLGTTLIVSSGEVVSMRIGLSLKTSAD